MSVMACHSKVPVLKSATQPTDGMWRRGLAMTVLWLGLGVVIGTSIARPTSSAGGYAAGALAGSIVLAPIGFLLGLAGGRWRETILGAAVGHGTGFAAGYVAGWGDPRFLAAAGLVYGALVGATVVGLFYRLPRLLMALRSVRGH